MFRNSLLLLGALLCVALMNGCPPVPAIVEMPSYEVAKGKITDIDENPIVGVKISVSYRNFGYENVTDKNGEFIILQLQTADDYDKTNSTDLKFVYDFIKLGIESPKDNVNLVISWNANVYDEQNYYIYLLDINKTVDNHTDVHCTECENLLYTNKYHVDFSKDFIELHYAGMKITIDAKMLVYLTKR